MLTFVTPVTLENRSNVLFLLKRTCSNEISNWTLRSSISRWKITDGYEKPAFLMRYIISAAYFHISKAKPNVNNLIPEFCDLLCEIRIC